MKLSIIYHSETGNTKSVAELVAKGAAKVEGVEAKSMHIDEVDEKFVQESKVAVLGTPIYGGMYSWQMKTWLHKGGVKLTGKLGGVFATENFLGGGADFAEMALIGEMLVRGMVVYSAGASEGQPFTHFGAVAIKDGDEWQRDRAEVFGERMARKGVELFGKE